MKKTVSIGGSIIARIPTELVWNILQMSEDSRRAFSLIESLTIPLKDDDKTLKNRLSHSLNKLGYCRIATAVNSNTVSDREIDTLFRDGCYALGVQVARVSSSMAVQWTTIEALNRSNKLTEEEKIVYIRRLALLILNEEGNDQFPFRTQAEWLVGNSVSSDFLDTLSKEVLEELILLCATFGRSHLRWFRSSIINLEPDERIRILYKAFGHAVENGHLNVLKWLYNTFQFEEWDVQKINTTAVMLAKACGQVEVVDWLCHSVALKQRGR